VQLRLHEHDVFAFLNTQIRCTIQFFASQGRYPIPIFGSIDSRRNRGEPYVITVRYDFSVGAYCCRFGLKVLKGRRTL
jgi:hypothetical protein